VTPLIYLAAGAYIGYQAGRYREREGVPPILQRSADIARAAAGEGRVANPFPPRLRPHMWGPGERAIDIIGQSGVPAGSMQERKLRELARLPSRTAPTENPTFIWVTN